MPLMMMAAARRCDDASTSANEAARKYCSHRNLIRSIFQWFIVILSPRRWFFSFVGRSRRWRRGRARCKNTDDMRARTHHIDILLVLVSLPFSISFCPSRLCERMPNAETAHEPLVITRSSRIDSAWQTGERTLIAISNLSLIRINSFSIRKVPGNNEIFAS